MTTVALAQPSDLGIVPMPVSVQSNGSKSIFEIPIKLYTSDQALALAAEMLVESLALTHDVKAELTDDPTSASVLLTLNPSAEGNNEAYILTSEAAGVTIRGDTAGVFYGLQTLIQLISKDPEGSHVSIPNVKIDDRPRFAWRGMHLDVVRHFRSVEFVKRYIDLMSRFKMNTLHWHLTDDQGWRIEIKAYPKLTEVGAWRKETMVAKNFNPYVGDGIPHGGFYIQDEIREVVAYAADRHITIVPEIEMPGHAVAALAAYPELACTSGPFEVATTWGVFEDVFCPTETTFEFLQTVLDEVIALFPSRYIHIGGDEVPKVRWQESDEAQAVMRREGLSNEEELQSWFIQRIERYLNSKGRLIIGWDEILEGGLAQNAAVMSWRGESGGIEAANHGNNAVMTPSFVLYFDHYQSNSGNEPLAIGGLSPLEKVYAYEPIPASLDSGLEHHVLGAQANIWTEYIKTEDHVEYMAFPRLMALAERVWSPENVRDFADFQLRLKPQYRLLDRMDVNYRIPDPIGFEPIATLADEALVELEAAHDGGCLQYTLDGTEPAEDAYCHPSFSQRIPLMEGAIATVKVVSVTSTGRRSDVRELEVKHLMMMPGLQRSNQSPGLERKLYMTSINRCSALDPSYEHTVDVVDGPSLPTDVSGRYAQVLAGYMEIPFDGIYTLSLTSDDGSVLWVDNFVEIDHDGYHSAATKSTKLALEYGLHPIRICHFEGGGGAMLRLQVMNARGEVVQIKYWR